MVDDAFLSPFGSGFEEEPEPLTEDDVDDIWTSLAAFGITTLLSFLGTTLATAACFQAVVDAYLRERPSARRSLSFAARQFHWVLVITLLTTFVPGILLFACIAPGVWLWVAWGVAIPALLTE